jgi:hypothetical protein
MVRTLAFLSASRFAVFSAFSLSLSRSFLAPYKLLIACSLLPHTKIKIKIIKKLDTYFEQGSEGLENGKEFFQLIFGVLSSKELKHVTKLRLHLGNQALGIPQLLAGHEREGLINS